MARPKKAIPDYRFHVSGQAVVTLYGRDYYLGRHDSPESRAKYLELVGIYNANGLTMPDEIDAHQKDAPITVACVTAEFRQHAQVRYADNANRRRRFERSCSLLEEKCGDCPVDQFGPRKLTALRDGFVAQGNGRVYVNERVREIVQVIRFGVSRELVDANVIVRLKSLEPLRAGQTTAPERKRRLPVDLASVRATAEHLSPVLRAMLRIQVATGMRSSEICNIRPRDIDRTGPDWFYRPGKHKTEHYDIRKAVPIIDDAREALTPYLLREADQFCFSPKESAHWYRDRRTANRKTPPSCGNRVGTNRKKLPKRQPRDRYTKDSYRAAIVRAATKAKVESWTPHQVRHLVATEIRAALGIEGAQHLLGHSKSAMTEHYARAKEEKAIEAARFAPRLA